jgi:mannitol/fructose-specific phosphotransferase system IIA component (Ntr-type)
MVTGALVVTALFLKVDLLVQAASVVFLMTYLLSNAAVMVLRESGLQNYRPAFRAPGYPWMQIAGIVGIMFVLLEMGEGSFAVVALLIVVGFCVYWFYGRSGPGIESALLHVIHRIAAREMVTGSLDAELKEIIRERDNIVRDRFDSIIEKSPILDLDDRVSCGDFFTAAAATLSPRVGVSEQELVEALRARERESSTVLAPGLAIPHVIIEGEGSFDILLARSRDGIDLSDEKPPVHIAFVLVGTRDERTLHLQALAAIAQVVKSPDFEKRWMAAPSEQALRDIVLLAERRRVSR